MEVKKAMVDFSQLGTCLAIVVICYLVGLAAKANENVKDNYIPIIVGAVGGILGIVAMYVIPDYPANDILNAIAVGIISGFASTGADQVYKQTKKNNA